MSGGYGLFQPGGRLPAHVHDFDESICIIDGEATCVVEGRRHTMSSGADRPAAARAGPLLHQRLRPTDGHALGLRRAEARAHRRRRALRDRRGRPLAQGGAAMNRPIPRRPDRRLLRPGRLDEVPRHRPVRLRRRSRRSNGRRFARASHRGSAADQIAGAQRRDRADARRCTAETVVARPATCWRSAASASATTPSTWRRAPRPTSSSSSPRARSIARWPRRPSAG